MFRKFTTTLAAAAVAATSLTATPVAADADRERLARWLAGATALIIIGSAINNSQAQAQPRQPQVHYQPRQPQVHYQPRGHQTPHSHPKPREQPRAHGLPPLPAYCIRHTSGRNGQYATMGARCLNKNYPAAHRLPEQCRESVRIKGDWYSAFKIACLKHRGFRIAGR